MADVVLLSTTLAFVTKMREKHNSPNAVQVKNQQKTKYKRN